MEDILSIISMKKYILYPEKITLFIIDDLGTLVSFTVQDEQLTVAGSRLKINQPYSHYTGCRIPALVLYCISGATVEPFTRGACIMSGRIMMITWKRASASFNNHLFIIPIRWVNPRAFPAAHLFSI